MKQTENLIFLHIPKNGGMTLHSILERIYSPENTFSIKVVDNTRLNTDDFTSLPFVERKKIKLLKEHMLYGLHKHLDGDSKYITFLRRPEDRILSFYHYVEKRPNHRLYKSIFGKGLSFHEFVEQLEVGDLHNAQVRWISGLEHGTEEEMLEKAIRNIKMHFAFVGFLEHYDVSLLMLSRIYKWGVPYYRQKNKGSYDAVNKGMDAKTLRLIKEKNAADIKLYSIIEKEFLEKKQKLKHLKLRLHILKIVNKFQYSYKVRKIKKFFN